MWVNDMTPEQKVEYGFVELSISDLHRLGYALTKQGWKKVETSGQVRVWQDGRLRIIHR